MASPAPGYWTLLISHLPGRNAVALKREGPGIHDDQRPARFRFAKAPRHQLLQIGATCATLPAIW